MLPRRLRLLTLVVPIAALVLAAPSAVAGETKSDKAILKAGVITKADVPAEWTSKRGDSSSDALKGIKDCRKINTAVAAAKQDNPRARSREFSDPVPEKATSAENAVYAFESKAPPAHSCRPTRAIGRWLASRGSRQRSGRIDPPPAHPPRRRSRTCKASATRRSATRSPPPSPRTAVPRPCTSTSSSCGSGAPPWASASRTSDARIPQGPDIVNAVVQRVAAAEA